MSDRPQRIQLSRKKGWRMPLNTVSVARRPHRSFGNPYTVAAAKALGFTGTDKSLRQLVTGFFANALEKGFDCVSFHRANIEELRGKNLACWCPLDHPCHADVLLKLANRRTTK
ncbi:MULTISPECIES: DUF4326 domain-containing protein [Hyphobacterium]|uniref:DUF4326 domain-containing protein n=1 Tax=Hyphobacterium vulgare TaxID=1736751 RepID=A0ABV6ZUA9_9PROT